MLIGRLSYDGRFVAEHGVGVDVEDLSRGRELIIDETGTVTLPPDVLLRIGGPGKYVTSILIMDC